MRIRMYLRIQEIRYLREIRVPSGTELMLRKHVLGGSWIGFSLNLPRERRGSLGETREFGI